MPRDRKLLGALFASLVTLSVLTCAQAAEATMRHFRGHDGRHAYRREDGIAVVPLALLGP